MYLNIQSFLANKTELCWLIEQWRPIIVCLTETHITQEVNEKERHIEGYKNFSCDSTSRHTGGSIIFIKSEIKAKQISTVVIDNNLWMIGIEAFIDSFKYNILCLYHSPNASHAIFLEKLEDILQNILSQEGYLVLIGDFNINIAVETHYSKKLTSLITTVGAHQHVNRFTRVTQQGGTIIDLIITHSKTTTYNVHLTPRITDHAILTVDLMKKPKHQILRKTIRDYSKFNETDFQFELMDKSWNNNIEDINIISENLVKNIQGTLDKYAPLKTVSMPITFGNKKWWTYEIDAEIRERDKLFRKATITKNTEDWSIFRQKRNKVVEMIRKSKQKYYQEKIDNVKNDSKKMWSTLKEITAQRPSSTTYDGIKFNNNIIRDNNLISEKFNEYFIDSINSITENLNCNNTTQMEVISTIPKSNYSLKEFKTIDFMDLKQIVKEMQNKNSSVDGINTSILKSSFQAIGHHFLHVINTSIQTGKFPEGWKTSTIIPIEKKTNSNLCEDFRPINMVPTCEKLLEVVVNQQLVSYIEENNILTCFQAGFRAKNSCESALQTVLANWKDSLKDNLVIGALFLDLRRAFETIDRQMLLQKLERYGIQGKALQWIKSYLFGRSQTTKFNNSHSTLLDTKFGVPQGTVMGPNFFVIYINDVIQHIHNCNIQLFADDTLIYFVGSNMREIVPRINEDMKNLASWLSKNNLCLNVGKTKFMVIRNIGNQLDVIQHPGILIDGQKIEQVKEFKYLGVIIDEHLTFSKQAEYITSKIARKVNVLGRMRRTLSQWSKTTLYKTLIMPHFNYCPTILFLLNNSEIETMQKRQNQALRVILDTNRYTSIKSMLDATGILSVRQSICLNTLIFIFKMVHGLLPGHLLENCISVRTIHNYETRNADNFYIRRVPRTSDQKNLFHKGLKLYNELPNNVKDCQTLQQFRKNCLKHVKDTIFI